MHRSKRWAIISPLSAYRNSHSSYLLTVATSLAIGAQCVGGAGGISDSSMIIPRSAFEISSFSLATLRWCLEQALVFIKFPSFHDYKAEHFCKYYHSSPIHVPHRTLRAFQSAASVSGTATSGGHGQKWPLDALLRI